MSPKALRIGGAVLLGLGGVGWVASAALAPVPVVVAPPLVVTEAYRFVEDRVARNETLSHVFGRHGIVGPQLVEALAVADGLRPNRIRPGDLFEFKYLVGDSLPVEVSHRLRNADEFLVLRRNANGSWQQDRREITWEVSVVRVSGAIRSSLWEVVGRVVGDTLLPRAEQQRMVSNIADDIFGWQVDFTRDIRAGDRFQLLFERLRSSEGEIRYGRLLAGKVETAGRTNSAYLMELDGRNQYYDERGRSLRRDFRLVPVQFARLSSQFSTSRFHPILRVRRPHLGTDYAANAGTPVRATADGTVIFAGYDRGYGRVVKLRHGAGIETRYAHLRSIPSGIRAGVRVRQDEVIGTVGMTGLATAPHVHYEFLKNGRHQNPRRVDLGDGRPIPAESRSEFEFAMQRFEAVLAGDPVPILSTN